MGVVIITETSDFNKLCGECNAIATEHGWWDDILETDGETEGDLVDIHNTYVYATKLALISCEVSEAIEDLRAKDDVHLGEELADIFIRLADLSVEMGYDLDYEIKRKMKINEGRPYKHGKVI